MKLKKAAALIMAGLMTFSMTACSGNSEADKQDTSANDNEAVEKEVAGNPDADENLVVWTLAEDLKEFAD